MPEKGYLLLCPILIGLILSLERYGLEIEGSRYFEDVNELFRLLSSTGLSNIFGVNLEFIIEKKNATSGFCRLGQFLKWGMKLTYPKSYPRILDRDIYFTSFSKKKNIKDKI